MSFDSPVFMVGSMRSGTTLLRLMLDHHPDIAFNLESEFLVTRISDDGNFPDIREYREFLRNDRSFQHSRFEIREDLDFVGTVNDFLEQKRTRDGKRIVGATVHYQFSKLDRIWPKARYIYIFRDGRDVASSVVGMGWAGNVYIAADWWIAAETEWEHYRKHLPYGSWIEVRYEELIANTREELTRICHFLGVDYSDRIFDYVRKSTYAMPDVSLNYQWKKKLNRRDVQRLEAKIGDRLLARGYELSGHPKIAVSGIERMYLTMHSRIRAVIYKFRKYGAMLVIQEFVTRRLGFKEQHKRLSRRVDEIIDANLK